MQRTRIVPLLTVPVLLAGAGLTACSSDGAKPAKIALEAAGVVAAQPFVQAPGADIRGVKATPVNGGTTRADAKGAFGGTPGQTHCDRAKLIDQLTQDPVKGKAWADVRGIAFERIKDHINNLSEKTLTQDTLVENHNYQGDGKTVAYLSVLQAGVTILWDDYGNPAVKCNCGNPLGKPEDVDRKGSTYTGNRWEHFEVTQITVIEARTIEEGPLKEVSLVDVRHPDKAFDRPAKGDGTTDGKPYSLPSPSPSRPGGSGSPSEPGSGSPSGSASGSASGSPSGPGTDSPSDSPSGSGSASGQGPSSTPSHSATLPGNGTGGHNPSSGGGQTASKPPSHPAPSRTGGSGGGGGGTHTPPPKSLAPPPPASGRTPGTAPTHATTAAPAHTTAVAPPPDRTTAVAPPARTAAPPERTAAPPERRTEAPPERTAAPPAVNPPAPTGHAPTGYQ
ncbi:DUF6777 domain-containing protein [Streptomyces sp. NPDC001678]|uniref:DUF6777 domain-containing protein n=1 Tax=Streptomyces sp. NPDC001678 TaxID=3364599 RepID=UPI0036AF18AB